jgi:hypothetical protein
MVNILNHHTEAEIREFERRNAEMTPEQFESCLVYGNILPKHKFIIDGETLTEAQRIETRARYDSVESELKKFDIEFKVTNWTEYEDGLQKLNRLKHDEQYY